jgi:S-formylglutathione hydrolase FrmB
MLAVGLLTAALTGLTPAVGFAAEGAAATSRNGTASTSVSSRILAPLATPAPLTAAGTRVGAGGLTVLSVNVIDDRMTDYTLSTPDLPAPTIVRVVLPVGYAAHRSARYPVQFLLAGCCTPGVRQAAWTDPDGGNAETLTAPYGVITVIPDGGLGSMYTDWAHPGTSGRMLWESYFVQQLLPWVDRRFHTTASPAGRAIVGVSMGGYGAAAIAARHPDLFAAMVSFSGIPDTNIRPYLFTEISGYDGGLEGSLWGPRKTEEVVWHGHNPTDLAVNLGGMKVLLASGNGKTGPLPDPNHGNLIEYLDHWDEYNAHQQTTAFAAALSAAGVRFSFDDYGNGEHVWPYWRADLIRTLPQLMRVFAAPRKAPASFSFTAIEPTFSVWGYSVTMVRRVTEFATLSKVTSRGFGLSGSGSALVTTAPRYVAGKTYSVTASTPKGRVAWKATADSAGRLRIAVILGASNTLQQYLPGSAAKRTLETAQITISAGS